MTITSLWRTSDISSPCHHAPWTSNTVASLWTPSSMAFWSKSSIMENPHVKAHRMMSTINAQYHPRTTSVLQVPNPPARTVSGFKSRVGARKETIQEIAANAVMGSRRTPMMATLRATEATRKMRARQLQNRLVEPVHTGNSVAPIEKGTRPDSMSGIIIDALSAASETLPY